jgi:16S rRNA (cytidine1402-2'-O)-methyltransferase
MSYRGEAREDWPGEAPGERPVEAPDDVPGERPGAGLDEAPDEDSGVTPFEAGADIVGGALYVVATPIGNREDITLRALRTLRAADYVAAEDTRRSGMLLRAYGIKKPLISCFAHNEQKQSQLLLALLREGKSVALISDAGLPGISDPGARVIRTLIDENIPLTVIPGASAGTTALVASGLDTAAFAFGGFIPRASKERRLWLERFGGFAGTVIIYESPRRLPATLVLLREHWGERQCCVAREMTKRFEEFRRGSLTEVARQLAERAGEIKGEIVLVVGGGVQERPALAPAAIRALAAELLAGGLRKKEASRSLAERGGISAKEAYQILVRCDKKQ